LSANRIVFLAINASYSHSSLAAWRLRSVIDAKEWEWHTVEVTINEDPTAALERVVRFRPAVLAATLYLFNRRYVTSVLKRYRRIDPVCRTIVGGPECLGDNRRLLTEEQVAEAAIRGEGEQAFPKWLAGLETLGRSRPDRAGRLQKREETRHCTDPCSHGALSSCVAGIPGFCGVVDGVYRDNGTAETVDDLDVLPPFYAHELAGFRKPFVQLETSRGCVNHCLFCTSRESALRYHSLERVRSDLRQIRDAGVREVRVVDRTFNARLDRALELLNLFRDEFPGLRFHLEIDPALVSEGLAVALEKAGAHRFHVEAGVQSLSTQVHCLTGRAATPAATLAGLRRLQAIAGLAVHGDLIAGLPGGRFADAIEDVKTLVLLGLDEIQLERLKLLPGTPLASDPGHWGLVAAEEPPYQILRTPDMTSDELRRVDRIARIVDGFYNVAVLRETCVAGVREIEGFLGEFAEFVAVRADGPFCPSLEQRFRWLDEFLSARNGRLVQGLRYQWFKCGFSTRQGLCPAEPWRTPVPESAILVEGDASKRFSQKWRVELDPPHLFCYGSGPRGERATVAVFRLQD
jgi:radical SAM superfamily enzyme YgiQ (UPF0313 family)